MPFRLKFFKLDCDIDAVSLAILLIFKELADIPRIVARNRYKVVVAHGVAQRIIHGVVDGNGGAGAHGGFANGNEHARNVALEIEKENDRRQGNADKYVQQPFFSFPLFAFWGIGRQVVVMKRAHERNNSRRMCSLAGVICDAASRWRKAVSSNVWSTP